MKERTFRWMDRTHGVTFNENCLIEPCHQENFQEFKKLIMSVQITQEGLAYRCTAFLTPEVLIVQLLGTGEPLQTIAELWLGRFPPKHRLKVIMAGGIRL